MNLNPESDTLTFVRLHRVSEENAMKEKAEEEKYDWGTGRGWN